MVGRRSWFLAYAWLVSIVCIGPAPVWSQPATVAPGDTVRLRPPARIEIPGVLSLDSDRLQTRKSYKEKDGVVIVQDGDRTLHVPRPGRTLAGRLVAVTDEMVTVRQGGGRTIDVPRLAVERLEVQRDGHGAAGGVIGAVAGFALGYALGYAMTKDCSSGWCFPEVAGAGAGLLLAIPAGAAGAALAGGKWEPVSTENLRVGVALRKDGATAGLTFRF